EYIEATGPVRHCAEISPNTGPVPGPNPTYHFQLPLAQIVGAIDPFVAGAGSFIAEFFGEDEIEWLDAAAESIEFPEFPEPVEPGENPFESLPEVGQVCFIDGDGLETCYDPEGREAMVFQPGLATSAAGIAMLVRDNSYHLSSMKIVDKQVTPAHRIPAGEKVEMTCPGEMRLSVSFFKAPAAPTTTVKYRFRFAGGPFSTTFSLELDGDKTVVHSVPIPLRRPLPQHSGGGVSPASSEFGVYVKPLDPIGGDPSPVANVGELVAEALPPNEHKGSVHVEVLNIPGGVITSGSQKYHVVCRPESGRPRLVVGMTGFTVLPLQSALNPWLTEAGRSPLKLDGVFGRTTEAAVIEFQSEKGLEPTGVVGPSTWRRLLEIRPYCQQHHREM
ncbi:MAG: peptidoglycan-binding domain-containing protein, partial [Novosphingobium sp.]